MSTQHRIVVGISVWTWVKTIASIIVAVALTIAILSYRAGELSGRTAVDAEWRKACAEYFMVTPEHPCYGKAQP